MKKTALLIASALTTFAAAAQSTPQFESQDGITAVGVYDSWEQSPFRTGELAGNVALIKNPFQNEYNPSEGVLAMQRSRFGSNRFGARIDLEEPIALSTKVRYVHAFIHKETEGRVMLIGLGTRTDRPGQKETEQFAVLSTSQVVTGEWFDAVFAISGAEGINVNTLVVVPDCESTHDLTADVAAYIDNIRINNNAAPSIAFEDYPLNFDRSTAMTRTDRYTSSISLTNESGGTQQISVGQLAAAKVFFDLTDQSFTAKIGEKASPTIGYSANTWMHSYIYLDRGQDGVFDMLNDDNGLPEEGSDIVSYSYIDGSNSLGVTGLSAGSSVQAPAFTVPADLVPGFYRLRYKLDWNNADPGGNVSTDNHIASNGGIIVDTRLNVHGDNVTIYRATAENGGGLNGDILKADGSDFTTEQIPFGKAFTISAQPAPGFRLSHIIVRHGYNLEGDSLIHGTAQYAEDTIPAYAFREGKYTLPAALIDGNVRLIPYFSATSGTSDTSTDYPTNFSKEEAVSSRTDRYLARVQLAASTGGTSSFNVSRADKHIYRDFTTRQLFVVPGDVIEPTIRYVGSGMHAYFYVDLDEDGQFSTSIDADGRPTMASELLSYTYLDGKNSAGEDIDTDALTPSTMPAFTLSNYLPAGVYRARLKVDYNNADPAGTWTEGGTENQIDENGGVVCDFLLNVHEAEHKLTVNTTGGTINGSAYKGLPATVTPGTAFQISARSTVPDWTCDSVVIRHGHRLDGPQYVHGNRQWSSYSVSPSTNISIPRDSVNGDVTISAVWTPSESADFRLVWNDEFDQADGTAEDAEKWHRHDRAKSTWNRFISNSDAEHALTGYVEDGAFLALCMPNPDTATDNVDMISGAIDTHTKFAFKYGRVEGRLRTEPHTGNFPAFWMMPEENVFGGWPYSGEIDIWEQINSENTSYHTIHSEWGNVLGNSSKPQKSGSVANVTNGNWHTFALDWTETLLTWYVDGVQVFSYAKSTDADALSNGQWPFDEKF